MYKKCYQGKKLGNNLFEMHLWESDDKHQVIPYQNEAYQICDDIDCEYTGLGGEPLRKIKDWFYFLFIISLINSINYSILTLFFSYTLILMDYLVNTFFTFLFYIIFVSIFKIYLKGVND